MPGMAGIDTLKEIRGINPDVMVIIITGYGTLQSAIEGIRYGVFDYISKPFSVPEIMQIIDKAVNRKRLNLKIKEFLKTFFDEPSPDSEANPNLLIQGSIQGLASFRWMDMGLSDNQNCLEFAKVLATTLEAKDPYTSGHSERVCYYSDVISRKLSLSPKDRTELQIAAYLHDIGKIGISDRFINKKETLNSTDWAVIRQHTQKSIELLAPLKLSSNIVSYIQYHHEHYDGTGYPGGLIGEHIPLGARIIALADSYDSMTSARPYRKPLSPGEARNELLKCSGKQFDPRLVSLFSDILKEMEEILFMTHHVKNASLSY